MIKNGSNKVHESFDALRYRSDFKISKEFNTLRKLEEKLNSAVGYDSYVHTTKADYLESVNRKNLFSYVKFFLYGNLFTYSDNL
jgi:hypothetical protein